MSILKATTRSLINRAKTHQSIKKTTISGRKQRKSIATAYKNARKNLGGAQVRANLTKIYGE